jgi:hypothetical protein
VKGRLPGYTGVWSLPPSSWKVHRQVCALVDTRSEQYVVCRPHKVPNPDHFQPRGLYEDYAVSLLTLAHQVYVRSELEVDHSLGAAPKVWTLGKALKSIRLRLLKQRSQKRVVPGTTFSRLRKLGTVPDSDKWCAFVHYKSSLARWRPSFPKPGDLRMLHP